MSAKIEIEGIDEGDLVGVDKVDGVTEVYTYGSWLCCVATVKLTDEKVKELIAALQNTLN